MVGVRLIGRLVVLEFNKNPGRNMFGVVILPVGFGRRKDKFGSLRQWNLKTKLLWPSPLSTMKLHTLEQSTHKN